MKKTIGKVYPTGLLPAAKVTDPTLAVDIASAVFAGGLNQIEFTMVDEITAECILAVRKAFPDMLIVAGNVFTSDMASAAVGAGADLVTGPGFLYEMVDYCVSSSIAVIPGCSSASEIAAAVDMGLDTVKLFPIETIGGLKSLDIFAETFPSVRFLVEGGIDMDNLSTYAKNPNVYACEGSFLINQEYVDAGNWDAITKDCAKALDTVLGFSIAHIGINCDGAEEAGAVANTLSSAFHLGCRETPISFFAGSLFETMNNSGKGTHGHIAVKSNNFDRSIAFLRSREVEFMQQSGLRNEKGELVLVYLKDEIGGFAIHMQR